MYFEDLTIYRYDPSGYLRSIIIFKNFVLNKCIGQKILNIGWLDSKHPFNQRKSDELFLDKLFDFCLNRVNQTRGYHLCPFCKSGFGLNVRRNKKKIILGSAEIRVKGNNGKIYAAPNLIYHYVESHNYCPPIEFVEAVLNS